MEKNKNYRFEIDNEKIHNRLEPGKIIDINKNGAYVNCIDGNLLLKKFKTHLEK